MTSPNPSYKEGDDMANSKGSEERTGDSRTEGGTTFLLHVAKDMLDKYGSDLSNIAVVFPNKRASLFLNAYLARLAGKPLWSPAYITISDLFRQQSERTVADPIKLVCDLYKSFTSQTGIDETLDHFYGWGQTLLADFDDIDKNLVDPDKLFANLRDIHELDGIDYLTEEQKAIIRKFFSNFSPDHNTQLKERFLKLWSRMGDIYHDFNSRIAEQGLAYEGALYREVATRLKPSPFTYDRYLFMGFNLLLPVERRLFAFLKSEGKAGFYWDFDHYYTRQLPQHEAGHFINQQLNDFPNAFDRDDEAIYNCFAQPKRLTFIAAPTENIQARYIPQWLASLSPTPQPTDGQRQNTPDTAVVLCNEALLQTVVHCLPPEVEKVNITTGYPLAQTPVAALITLLIDLRTNGYATQRERYRLHHVNAVLRHPYITPLSDAIPTLLERLNTDKVYYSSTEELAIDDTTALIFRPLDGSNAELLRWLCDIMQRVATHHSTLNTTLSPLLQESVFKAYTLLNRLQTLVDDGDLTVDVITLQRLITQIVQSTSIPFHGEPAEGLQVMGVLETRNLDFRHLLLLSCNEGNMPRGTNDASFIPYNIRKAFGLTTIDHKVAIYSYYFHRLLQRADDVTIVYNNATADGQRGEMSRFMLQLMVESPHQITYRTLQASQKHTPFRPPTIAKTPEVMERLLRHFSCTVDANGKPSDRAPLLTPTAVNRYLRCPLIFYYTYVHDLREPDITDDDTIDSRLFGNIFHEAARIVYTRLMKKSHQILASDIEVMLKEKVDIIRAVYEAFQKELFRTTHATQLSALNGLQLINREVIIHYLRQLLTIDSKLAPFTIIGLECDVVAPYTLHEPYLTTTIGGRIDRLDCIVEDGRQRIRVIDYKTGSHRLKPLADVDAIFQQENLKNHSDYYLQAMLYACLVKRNHPQTAVSPALLFIQHAGVDDYDPTLFFGNDRIDDANDHATRFGELLGATIADMFNPDIPFASTDDHSRCTNCPYRLLCTAASL